MTRPLVLTLGHSSRSFDDFLALLRAHEVVHVADVRAYPASRRHPQFDSAVLDASLRREGVGYTHVPELGGMRTARPDSPHTALREEAFRAYADHMESDAFARGVETLLALARVARTAVMCAEARPEQCHRALLSDALLVRGVRVEHAVSATERFGHVLNPAARRDGERLIYSGQQESLGL